MTFRSADRGDCTPCPREQPWACHPGPGRRRHGFTLVELLVAASIMSVMIIGISVVFKAASAASGITEADIRALESLRVLDQALREDLENHFATSQGLLIIHSELTASTESLEGGVDRLARVDRLAMTARGRYESVTATLKDIGPVSSDAALLMYGHGHPGRISANQPTGPITPQLGGDDPPQGPRVEWILCRRAILFGIPDSNDIIYHLGERPLDNMFPAPAVRWESTYGRIYKSLSDGLQARLGDFAAAMAQSGGGQPPLRNLQGIYYARSLVPATVGPTTHRRAFPIMLPNTSDFLVEWTDGSFVQPGPVNPFTGKRGDPIDSRVQWFGLPRDTNGDGNIAPFSGDTMTKIDWLLGPDHARDLLGAPSTDDFGAPDVLTAFTGIDISGQQTGVPIESFPFDASAPYRPSGVGGNYYHASWFSVSASQWRFRPKAFRISIRLYDTALRLTASTRERSPGVEQHLRTPLPQGSDRFGRQFTLVVP